MFASDESDLPPVPARKPDRGFSGFWEGVGAAYRAETIETDAWLQRGHTERSILEGLEADVRQSLGDARVDAMLSDGTRRRETSEMRARRRADALRRAAEEAGLEPVDVEATARTRLQEERDDAMATLDFMRGGRTVGEFVGRSGAAMTDPVSIGLALTTGGTGSVARVIAREALMGAVGEAMILPRMGEMAEYLDIEAPNPVAQVAMGAAFGGALGGAAVGLQRGLTYARQRTGQARPSETTPAMTPEEIAGIDAAEDALIAGRPVPLEVEDVPPSELPDVLPDELAGELADDLAVEPAGDPVPDTTPAEPLTPADVVNITNEDLATIGTEPEVFQYKSGGDAEGVTDALRGVTQWDTNRAQIKTVYEYLDGRRVIVDGHQSLGLARRLAAEGQRISLPVRILREADGVTPSQARLLGAEANIANNTGTALDAAKVIRESGRSITSFGFPGNNALARDGGDMAKLSDDAFGMVWNGVSSERDAAMVGRIVPDPARHADILGLLTRLKPRTAVEAEAIVRQAVMSEVRETQVDMFGELEVSANLYLERAKVLREALNGLKKDKAAFANLLRNADAIVERGNVLDADANAAARNDAARAEATLMKQANQRGPTSDALTEAARAVKGGESVAAAARRFVTGLGRDDGNGAPRGGETADGAGEAGPGAGGTQPDLTPDLLAEPDTTPDLLSEMTPEGEQFVIPGAERNDAASAAVRSREATDEMRVRAAQSRTGTVARQDAPGGMFAEPDPDLFADPKVTEAAGAELRREVEADGDFEVTIDGRTMTATGFLDDVDADAEFVAIINECGIR